MKTPCMRLDCKNIVNRHPYDFRTGFCDDCQDEYYEAISKLNEIINNE